ncbi:APC family permease [Catenulispora sp. NF23]|uniref:APC family permease n=1 Tax=Catenulispora pinistramenti TaxID=2705254 RepID=UPI001BA7DBA1|nr:APC family permease [Catenulispora pinistramenti]MBS2533955.1 APC family permease [Catenulispora pinistramenti]
MSEITTPTAPRVDADGQGLVRSTDWKGAFAIGLAGTILVTGIDPAAVQALGAAAIPLIAVLTATGVVLCLMLAELAAMMPHRTGGLPSYAYETYKPLGRRTAAHAGGLSAWAYWLGWFPVAPINMILAAAYLVDIFHLPVGHRLQVFGSIGSPVGLTTLIVAVLGILLMFVPCYLGIKFGAGFAAVLGVASMVPLTLFILLPLARPSKFHLAAVAGFHLPAGVHASFGLFVAWAFVMTWSVLAMEAAACYIGECREPTRDAKIAMSVEGGYGLFTFVFTAVVIVGVVGVTVNVDPLTVYTQVVSEIFGSHAEAVQYVLGIPLIIALTLSVLNAIAGSARSLYQVAHDGMLPRWFMKVNRHGTPARAMAFNAAASIVVLFFGSPVRIYVFSNMGYLSSIAVALFGYFLHRHYRPELARPVRLPSGAKWVALALALAFAFIWAYGGWQSPRLVVGEDNERLFFLGLAVLLAYLPLYWWRRYSDGKRAGAEPPERNGV